MLLRRISLKSFKIIEPLVISSIAIESEHQSVFGRKSILFFNFVLFSFEKSFDQVGENSLCSTIFASNFLIKWGFLSFKSKLWIAIAPTFSIEFSVNIFRLNFSIIFRPFPSNSGLLHRRELWGAFYFGLISCRARSWLGIIFGQILHQNDTARVSTCQWSPGIWSRSCQADESGESNQPKGWKGENQLYGTSILVSKS